MSNDHWSSNCTTGLRYCKNRSEQTVHNLFGEKNITNNNKKLLKWHTCSSNQYCNLVSTSPPVSHHISTSEPPHLHQWATTSPSIMSHHLLGKESLHFHNLTTASPPISQLHVMNHHHPPISIQRATTSQKICQLHHTIKFCSNYCKGTVSREFYLSWCCRGLD